MLILPIHEHGRLLHFLRNSIILSTREPFNISTCFFFVCFELILFLSYTMAMSLVYLDFSSFRLARRLRLILPWFYLHNGNEPCVPRLLFASSRTQASPYTSLILLTQRQWALCTSTSLRFVSVTGFALYKRKRLHTFLCKHKCVNSFSFIHGSLPLCKYSVRFALWIFHKRYLYS